MKQLRSRSYGHLSLWLGAILVGSAAVLYARTISIAQARYFQLFQNHPLLLTAVTPLFFLGATALVRIFAPDAKGSGIPQVLEAIDEPEKNPDLVSLKTAGFKVLSSVLGILGGASIGREGPTVQIASSGFAWIARLTRKKVPNLNFPSYLVAGAAAGVAAAFNTPLAGIAFAIEELAEGIFGHLRQTVMLAVIIAGITAQG